MAVIRVSLEMEGLLAALLLCCMVLDLVGDFLELLPRGPVACIG